MLFRSDDASLIDHGPWFQCHWDRWTLPPKAKEIARSPIASQAFVCGRTLALQFHPEIERDVLETWMKNDELCAQIEGEGMSSSILLQQTSFEEKSAQERAAGLVDTFLDQIATNEIVPV